MTQAKPSLLMLTSSFPASPDDETCGYVRDLARCVAQEFAVQVLAPAEVRAEATSYPEFQLTRSHSLLPPALDPLQASRDWHGVLAGNLLTKLLTAISLLGFLVTAFRLARRAEVICSHWLLPAGLIGAVLSRVLRKPHLVIEHSGALHWLMRRRGGGWLLRFIVSGSHRLVTVSDDLRQKLIRLCPAAEAKTTVMPMGIKVSVFEAEGISARPTFKAQQCCEDEAKKMYGRSSLTAPDVFPSALPAGATTEGGPHKGDDSPSLYKLLFIGRLVEIKGVHILLQAAATLPQVQVLIAGDGEQRMALARLAKKLNVDAVFFGTVDKTEKARLLKLCDAVVLPSVCLPDGRCEGMPVVALEALAAGRPLIAARVGGVSEIIEAGQNGLLFTAGNPSLLADKIKLLRDDKTLRERLAKNAKRTAQAYDWQLIGATFNDLLKDSLTANGSVTGYQTAARSNC
ncbi:MAG: glycosyltransferase [Acidobacteria bacterium]|nr:glycosyltransferase [Acidobacteriota bacterium]